MNLTPNAKHQARNPKRNSGSATILVFALLGLMVVFLNSNQLTLHSLKRDLRLVEAKQLKKFQAPPKPLPPELP